MTVVAGLWLIAGLFLDGYAHQHLVTGTESFVTPWHAVFYSGFAAASFWLGIIVMRRPGRRLRDRIPPGYEATSIGLAAFALGAIGDGVWHSIFGVEVGIDALLSPTHLVLMGGLMAIVTAPYRAARARQDGARRGLALISLGVGTALAAFFLNFVWGLGDGGFRVAYDPGSGGGELFVIAGVGSVLATTALLCGSVVLALRLGKTRFGTFTAMFGLIAAAVHLAFEEEAIGVLAAFVAGVVMDAVLAVNAEGAQTKIAFGGSIGALWAVYYVVPFFRGELAWPPELWLGTIVLAIFAAVAIAIVGSQSPAPLTVRDPTAFLPIETAAGSPA